MNQDLSRIFANDVTNVPQLRNMDCTPSCTWTRTVRNTVTTATSWTATGSAITPGFTVDVSPSNFSFSGGLDETQELTITATPNTALNSVAFGQVLLHQGANGNEPRGVAIPDERITVAIETTGGATPTPTPSPTPGGSCPPTITESSSQEIITGNSASCNNANITAQNSYWRAFNMNAFTGGAEYDVTSVDFGIEQAMGGSGGSQPATVNLYANHGAAFPGGDWQSNMIATVPVTIPDQDNTVLNQVIAATVAPGTLELVMELNIPDGSAAQNVFFVGSNTDPQTADSYISASDCSIDTPTPTEDIGFPDMHIVFNVHGTCPGGTPTPTPTGTPSVTPTPPPTATPRATPRPRPTPHPRPTPP